MQSKEAVHSKNNANCTVIDNNVTELKQWRDHTLSEFVNHIIYLNKKDNFQINLLKETGNSFDLNEIFQSTVEKLGLHLNANRCTILLYNYKTEMFETISEYKSVSELASIQCNSLPINTCKELNKLIVLKHKTVIINNTESDHIPGNEKEFYQNYNIRSVAMQPIVNSEEILGLLYIDHNYLREMSGTETLLLEETANRISLAIKKMQLYRELKLKTEREELFKKITETLNSSLDENEIQNKLVTEVGRLFKADKCFIIRFDLIKNVYLPIDECADYMSSPDIKGKYSLGEAEESYVIENYKLGKMFRLHDTELLKNNGQIPIIRSIGRVIHDDYNMRSSYCYPMFHKDELIGSFAIQYKEKTYLSDEDIELLAMVANQTAVALRQAKLHSELRIKAEREALLRSIAETIRSSLDPEEIQSKLVTTVGKAFKADKCFIKPIDNVNEDFLPIPAYAEFFSRPELKKPYYFSKEIHKFAIQEYKKGINFEIPDAELLKNVDNPYVREFVNRLVDVYNTKSNYCYPMFHKDELLAAFVIQYSKPTALPKEDIELLRIVVDQAAIALKQADLYNQTIKATKVKSEFVTNMSHELRTPLTAIIGFIELILFRNNKDIPQNVQNYLNIALKNSHHLLNLINDLLDISKIEAGKLELKYEQFDSSRQIYEVISGLQPIASNKKIRIDMFLENISIKADNKRFTQIIYNLLSNAVKFTPEYGVVTIRSSLSGSDIIISVENTGPGIPEEDQRRIFNKFEQLDSKGKKPNEGTGLGLAITKNLIELHGGSIHLESGKGTNFWFILPG